MSNTTGYLTDYELGNMALHRVSEELGELAIDCRKSHPVQSKFFNKLSSAFNTYGQTMEEDEIGQRRLAFAKLRAAIRDAYYRARAKNAKS